MARIRLNDNCHGKVLFISDSVKKKPCASCKLLKKLPENQVIKFIWPYMYLINEIKTYMYLSIYNASHCDGVDVCLALCFDAYS